MRVARKVALFIQSVLSGVLLGHVLVWITSKKGARLDIIRSVSDHTIALNLPHMVRVS